MELTAILTAVKTFGPWVFYALVAGAIGLLWVDRNHLAALNDRHVACMAAVDNKPGAKPLATVCDAPLPTAVQDGWAAASCDLALQSGNAFAASQSCSTGVKTVIAQRDSGVTEVANLRGQLAQAEALQTAAVSRAEARAKATAQGLSHAQSVLDAAPRGADGLSVCDADCLRGLTAPAQPSGPGA